MCTPPGSATVGRGASARFALFASLGVHGGVLAAVAVFGVGIYDGPAPARATEHAITACLPADALVDPPPEPAPEFPPVERVTEECRVDEAPAVELEPPSTERPEQPRACWSPLDARVHVESASGWSPRGRGRTGSESAQSAEAVSDVVEPAPARAAPVESPPSARTSPARVVRRPAPEYPERARCAGWQGRVMLRVTVAADGSVSDVALETSCGHDVLDRAAEAAVRIWTFEPAYRDGVAVESRFRVPVSFRLVS